VLGDRRNGPREIIVLTDGQKQSWADETSLARWEILSQQHAAEAGADAPRVYVVNLAADRPTQPANWSLALPKVSRAVAAARQTVVFQTALLRLGAGDRPVPERVRCELDGRSAGEARPPAAALTQGQYPLTFKVKMDTPGSHVVAIALDKEGLPGENRRDYAVEVLKELPVLMVDGDTRPSPPRRGVDYIRRALAPKNDPTPSVRAAVVDADHFAPELLTRPVGESGAAPRVLFLGNVTKLTAAQQEGVERFLAGGGSVFVALGSRVEAAAYNEQLHRDGKGWFPVKLTEPVGDEADLAKAQRPNPASFGHPALELFRETNEGGLAEVRFPRYWKMTIPPETRATPIARLTNNDPWLVEAPYKAGRVIVSAVPFDDTWRTNLPSSQTPAFVPLCHELTFYLAGAKAAELNLQPGQPIRFRPQGDEQPGPVTVQPPEGSPQVLPVAAWPALWEETREPGVYKLTSAGGSVGYFVVQSDPQEADLAPNSDADRQKVKDLVPGLAYAESASVESALAARPAQNLELWWLLMVGVIALLASEVWLTRRVAQGPG
jgi:hypothetical protein